MSNTNATTPPTSTTSAADRLGVEQLNASLLAFNRKQTNSSTSPSSSSSNSDPNAVSPIISVSLDEGIHKYVIITATLPSNSPILPNNKAALLNNTCTFVVSKAGAEYHKDVASPFISTLLASDNVNQFSSVKVTGGGRINVNSQERKVEIYGFSYGYGKGDHALAKSVVDGDGGFEGWDVSWNDEGY